MKRSVILSTLLAGMIFSTPAWAEGKWFYWSWPPGHFLNLEFDQRYLETGKLPHNRQWDKRAWTPSVWIEQRRGGLRLIEGFYQSDILEAQKVKNDIPYLYVGENFYNLSAYDQRRVVETVDEVYSVTSPFNDNLFYLYDDRKDEIIGMYTHFGMQLQ